MIKEKGLKTDRPIEQYMALAIQPAMVGTSKKEDIKRNVDHITDIIRAGFWLGGISMPPNQKPARMISVMLTT